MDNIMKARAITILIVFGLLESLFGQEVQLPDKISISDKYLTPFGTNLFYEYELKLKGNHYSIHATVAKEHSESSENKARQNRLGIIHKKLIGNILTTIKKQPTQEIKSSDFADIFSVNAIKSFFKKEGENYWIFNEHQKHFIFNELTNPEKLNDNLEFFFRNYDGSKGTDGSLSDVKITFHFADSVLSISTKSILWLGLPLEINGVKYYSPSLARQIAWLFPKSKTKRKEQFEGKGFFSGAIRETIGYHSTQLRILEAKTYKTHLDSLTNMFTVSDAMVTHGFSLDGGTRLICKLIDSTMVSNVSINYSTQINNGKVKYPVLLVLKDYRRLYASVVSSAFFMEYLSGNKERHLSIVFDNNNCFTDKARESGLASCILQNTVDSFDNMVSISIKNEFGNISRWGLLSNGQYYMWWNNGNPPIPSDDKKYLKCE